MRVPTDREVLVRRFVDLTRRHFPDAETRLDVGCGPLCGIFNKIYGEDNYTGLDLKSCPFPVDVYGDVQDLEYRADLFDVATGWSVIEHLLNPYGGMLEMLRVSKMGFIITTDLSKRDKDNDPTHLYSWTPKTLRQLFKKLPARETYVFPEGNLLVGVAYK